MNLPFEDILQGIAELKQLVSKQQEAIEKLSVAKPLDGKMTREQVADHFNKSPQTIDRWVEDGLLQYYGLGGARWFLQSEIESCGIKINTLKKVA